MLLEPLMSRTKKNNDERQDYATSFFMSKSKCKKEPNKYYRRKCVSFKCQDCKDITPANLICQTAQETVKVSQFELTKVPFTKINKHHNFIQKANNKTDKIEKVMSYKELNQKKKKKHTSHKYQICNDIYHWPIILIHNTTNRSNLQYGLFRKHQPNA